MAAKHIRHEVLTHDEQVARVGGVPDALSAPGVESEAAENLAAGGQSSAVPPLSRDHAISRYMSRRGGRKRSSVLRRALVGTAVVAIVIALVTVGFARLVNARLSNGLDENLRAALTSVTTDDPFYVLAVGLDEGGVLEPVDAAPNADALMLARVDVPARRIALISLSPDTEIAFDGAAAQSLNSVYISGGAPALVRAIERLTSVSISHYVMADFDGFASIVDQIGGIDVVLPVAVSDPDYTGLDLAAGDQHLDGYTTLMLARSSHAYDAFDVAWACRAANQRVVAASIASAVLGTTMRALPGTIATLADYVTTDLDVVSLAHMLYGLGGLRAADICGCVLPTTSVERGETWHEMLDETTWEDMRGRIDAGDDPYPEHVYDPTLGIAASLGVGAAADEGRQDGESAHGVAADIEPEYAGTVSVLNATGVQRLAADAAATLAARGFESTASNASEPADTSRVVYNGDDALGKALAVAEVLGIVGEPAANDGTLPIDANVIVVLGADAT